MTIHFAEWVVDQFETFTIGAREVQRRLSHEERGDPGRFQLRLQAIPVVGLDGDSEVVVPAKHLGVLLQTKAWEVKERKRIAVADVEKEVGRAVVVPVLEEFGQRELEEVLVELDRPDDIR